MEGRTSPHALGVPSRHLVDRVEDETIRLRSPGFADVFVGREAVQRLQSAGEVAACGRRTPAVETHGVSARAC